MATPKEYGGYPSFETFYGEEYHQNMLAFDSVRSAFVYILQEKQYTQVLLPRYLCGCMKAVLQALHVPFAYYSIDRDFTPILPRAVEKDECFFFVNYFGQFSAEWIEQYHKRYPTLFVDNTQAFFDRPARGVDTAYNCRKYFRVADGAYLSTDAPTNAYCDLSYNRTYNQMLYLMGRFETCAAEHYAAFVAWEQVPRGVPPKRMSRLSQNLLRGIPYARVIQKRSGNFNFLHRQFSDLNQLAIRNDAGLFLYPLLMENGEAIKKKLIEKHIYVPTFWPDAEACADESFEAQLIRDLILLPIDQRYGTEDMEELSERFFEGLKELE